MNNNQYPDLSKPSKEEDDKYPDLSKPEMVSTFMGQAPKAQEGQGIYGTQNVEDIINSAVGSPGIKMAGAGVINFGKGISSVLNKPAFRPLMEGIQKGHDKLLQQSSDLYNFIKSEVGPRGVGKINISSDLIKEAEANLPKTRSNKQLLEKASTGDYEALHQLQSDLGKKGTKNLGADLNADRNIGEEMLDTREKINESMANHFKEYGYEDLSKLLEEARGKYRKLKDIYYSHPSIAKLVNPESRKMISNPFKVFSEESIPMNKVLNAHPEVKSAVDTHNVAKNFMNKLKNIGLTTSAAGISSLGVDKLAKLLMTRGSE